MAGRHGNKGVISRILPSEDMPFLADGTPLDVVLNPLGVPSRMNIGQVLEVHLGIAAKQLGWHVMSPVFDGAKESEIVELLEKAHIHRPLEEKETVMGKELFRQDLDENGVEVLNRITPEWVNENQQEFEELKARQRIRVVDGKTTLYDGRTGEPFSNPVTVGYMYFPSFIILLTIKSMPVPPRLLLSPSSLWGQSPVRRPAVPGMEVQALEAYGAAYTLQEILTVKSDDVKGRVKTYEAIVKTQHPHSGIPASFKVLVGNWALCLDVRVLDRDDGNQS